jgi:hypothetical protein
MCVRMRQEGIEGGVPSKVGIISRFFIEVTYVSI